MKFDPYPLQIADIFYGQSLDEYDFRVFVKEIVERRHGEPIPIFAWNGLFGQPGR